MVENQYIEPAIKFIDSWLRYKFERTELPGAVVGIFHEGKELLTCAYGFANIEKKEKMTTQHSFRIASHSKTFTATAIMILQEQGKLKLDDKIVEYLDWLNNHKDKRWQKVTIRQLLSHTAGVIRDGEAADYWVVEKPFPSESIFRKEILASKLVFDNNVELKYSNYGYTLLGMIISKVANQPFNNYVLQKIIKPLNLQNTYPEFDNKSKHVTGYSQKQPAKRLSIAPINTRIMSPATGFSSTIKDIGKYFSAHQIGNNKLLDDESKKEMQRTQAIIRTQAGEVEEYGLGFSIYLQDKIRLFGHGGGFPGQITKTMCDPQNKLIVSALTNSIDGNAEEICRGILSVLYKFQTATGKSNIGIRKFEGRYLNLWNTIDIVSLGEKIYAANSGVWYPFAYATELEYVFPYKLKIKHSDPFGSPGEIVELKSDRKIIYAGATMHKEEDYLRAIAIKKVISPTNN